MHRDVKPGNLMLDGQEHVHVADFGIASATGMDSLTMTGTVLGTAGYLSPEQAEGERAGPASDRYALAVVAWELLTGKRPFQADSPTAEAAAHVNAPIPSVCDRSKLPCELDPVFVKALAKNPEERYRSAEEFVADLRGAFAEAAGKTVELAAVPAPAPVPVPPEVHRAPAAERRTWPLLAALLVAGAVAGALLAFLLTRDDSPNNPGTTVVTQERTVTEQGRVTTVERPVTVTTSAAPTARTAASPPSGQSGAALNDAGFAKMQAGDYTGALPLLEQAVQKLSGTGSLAEAYASYNLAFTRFALGSCDGVLALLDRSEAVQGNRSEIDRLRSQADVRC